MSMSVITTYDINTQDCLLKKPGWPGELVGRVSQVRRREGQALRRHLICPTLPYPPDPAHLTLLGGDVHLDLTRFGFFTKRKPDRQHTVSIVRCDL